MTSSLLEDHTEHGEHQGLCPRKQAVGRKHAYGRCLCSGLRAKWLKEKSILLSTVLSFGGMSLLGHAQGVNQTLCSPETGVPKMKFSKEEADSHW